MTRQISEPEAIRIIWSDDIQWHKESPLTGDFFASDARLEHGWNINKYADPGSGCK